MKTKLKNIAEQTMVITGASSGIGLVTARMAAAKGARVMLASRNETALQQIVDELNADGAKASYVVADVGNLDDVRRIHDTTMQVFGGFDTWFNDAAVSIYGKLEEIPIEDHRRLFETNYWGVVYGSLVALPHLRQYGGALINMGSVLSDRAIPIQGAYCAAKHAVKGFTDALRMELETDRAPVSVTLIKPSAIDTPYMDHAKNFLPVAPKNPPPIYAPENVAEAVLHAAQHPLRDVVVGGAGRLISTLGRLMPRASDIVMEYTMPYLQQTNEPPRPRERNNLYAPMEDGHERSRLDAFVLENSVYTKARLHPVATALIAVGVGAVAATAAMRARP